MKLFEDENLEKIFKDIEIKEEYFEKNRFSKCKFINCYIEKSKFVSCRFSECTFQKCTIIDIDLTQSTFDDVEFYESKVFTVNWSLIRDFHTKIQFRKCKTHYCIFQDLNLLDFRMIDTEAYECDFVNSRLDNSVWDGSTLERSNFVKCFIKDADFSKAKQYLISAKENKIIKSRFSWPEVSDSLRILGMEVE